MHRIQRDLEGKKVDKLAIGYYFILFDCYGDVTNDAQIWRQN